MPSSNISPQVILQEIDLSEVVGGSPGVYTSIVLHSKKGPTEPTLVTSEKEFISLFGTPSSIDFYAGYSACTYLRYGGNKLWVNRVISADCAHSAIAVMREDQDDEVTALPVPLTDPKNILFTTDVASAPAGAIALDDSTLFVVYARDPGVVGDTISIKVERILDPLDITGNVFTDDFLVQVFCADDGCMIGTPVEEWVVSRDQKVDGYQKSMYIEDLINSRSRFIRVMDNRLNAASQSPKDFSDAGITAPGLGLLGGVAGLTPGMAEYITGLQRFRNKDYFPIKIMLNGGTPWEQYFVEMDQVAQMRQDCIAVFTDTCEFAISSTYTNALVDWRKSNLGIDSSYSALYATSVKWYDNYAGRYEFIPIDGFVAAAVSKNFYNREVWFAPAGWNYGKLPVTSVAKEFNLAERDYLYQNNINPVRFKPGRGIAIWGQKTLQVKKSALDRVNVRLLLIEVESAILELLENFEFEFNDEFTRNRIQTIINSYLDSIKARRGLYEYTTVCDDSNNTSEVIDNNMMYVDTYLQPIKTAEVIVYRSIVTRTGATLDDVKQGV